MKINKPVLIAGFLLVFGSTFILPFLGVGFTFLFGDAELDRLLSANQEALPVITIVLIGVSVLIPLIGVAMIFGAVLIPFIMSRRAKNRILAEGQAAEARILALDDTGTRINDNPLVSFTLEVYPMTQPPFRAVVRQTVSVIHLPSYQPGKFVNVKYLPGTNEVAITGAKYV